MNEFEEKINTLGRKFIIGVYQLSKELPDDEKYALVQQLRRAATSVMLNYVEGRARRSDKTYSHLINCSYGSLKESLYIIELLPDLGYVKNERIVDIVKDGDELGAMLYTILKKLREI